MNACDLPFRTLTLSKSNWHSTQGHAAEQPAAPMEYSAYIPDPGSGGVYAHLLTNA